MINIKIYMYIYKSHILNFRQSFSSKMGKKKTPRIVINLVILLINITNFYMLSFIERIILNFFMNNFYYKSIEINE